MKTIQYILLVLITTTSLAQVSKSSDLFQQMKTLDSIVFEVGFNNCNLAPTEAILTSDFEFYHDKGGLTEGKEAFVGGIERGCSNRDAKLSQPAKRILVTGSLEVYPMYKNGKLYGAIQHGIHSFEFLNENQEYE